MTNFQFSSIFLTLTFLFISTHSHAQYDERKRVPFLKGDYYGVSDLEGNLVLDAKFDFVETKGTWSIVRAKKEGKLNFYKATGEMFLEGVTEPFKITKMSKENDFFQVVLEKSNTFIYVNPFSDQPAFEVVHDQSYMEARCLNRIAYIKTNEGYVLLDGNGAKLDVPPVRKVDYFNCLTIVTLKDDKGRLFYDSNGNYLGENAKSLGYGWDINRILVVNDTSQYFLDKDCTVVDSCTDCTFKTFKSSLFFKIKNSDTLEVRNIENEVLHTFFGPNVQPIKNDFFNSYAYIKTNDQYQLIDANNEIIEGFTFKWLKEFTNDIIYIKSGKDIQFLDKNLNVLSTIQDFDIVTTPKQWKDQLFWVTKDIGGRPFASIINRNGKVILDAFTEDYVKANQKCNLIFAEKDYIYHLFSGQDGALLYESENRFNYSCDGDSITIDEDGKLMAFHRDSPTETTPKTRIKKTQTQREDEEELLEDSLLTVFDEVKDVRGVNDCYMVRKGKEIRIFKDQLMDYVLPFDSIPKTNKINAFYFTVEVDQENKEYLIFSKDGTYVNQTKGMFLTGTWRGYNFTPIGFLASNAENKKRFLFNVETLKEYRE